MSSADDPGEDPHADPADDLERRLLGAERRLRRREASNAAGVSLLSARRFRRALRFPNVGEAAEAFTDADVAALRCMVGLVRDGVLDDETALGLTRSLGRSADRLANWQIQLLAEHVSEHLGDGRQRAPDADSAARVGALLAEVVERTEPLLGYAWRRHLASAVARMVCDAGVGAAASTGASCAAWAR